MRIKDYRLPTEKPFSEMLQIYCYRLRTVSVSVIVSLPVIVLFRFPLTSLLVVGLAGLVSLFALVVLLLVPGAVPWLYRALTSAPAASGVEEPALGGIDESRPSNFMNEWIEYLEGMLGDYLELVQIESYERVPSKLSVLITPLFISPALLTSLLEIWRESVGTRIWIELGREFSRDV